MVMLPEYLAVNVMTLDCPGAMHSREKPVRWINDLAELMHLERIEAAISLDMTPNKPN
jgi:hypothetical protein